ncbi:MAG: hypothetical protein AB1589_46095, partial [Cyanobacteriota bacterium]
VKHTNLDQYRLAKEDLFEVLQMWDNEIRSKLLLVACGGTALTLLGHKETTKDVDFLIPIPAQYEVLVKTLLKLGYTEKTGTGYMHPNNPWIFDLYSGQTVFQTSFIEPIHNDGLHLVIERYQRIILACLNFEDLIISKMFRGTSVDVDDSVLLIESEGLDLVSLFERYRETASYYFDPPTCKFNLGLLIDQLEEKQFDVGTIRELHRQWNP